MYKYHNSESKKDTKNTKTRQIKWEPTEVPREIHLLNTREHVYTKTIPAESEKASRPKTKRENNKQAEPKLPEAE